MAKPVLTFCDSGLIKFVYLLFQSNLKHSKDVRDIKKISGALTMLQ